MLSAQTSDIETSGHVGDTILAFHLNAYYPNITQIQADGDELEKCCEILGRPLPRRRDFIFLGDDAKTIAANWD